MQDRPTAPELLDAMAADLFAKVREWVPRERRFQVLALANLCAVIARELRAGAEPSLADVRLFRELLRRPRERPAAGARRHPGRRRRAPPRPGRARSPWRVGPEPVSSTTSCPVRWCACAST